MHKAIVDYSSRWNDKILLSKGLDLITGHNHFQRWKWPGQSFKLYLSLVQLIFRLIKSSSLIVVLTVHCLAVQTTGQEKDSSKSFPAHLKEISRRESKDKRLMIPEAVWKLSGIPKPYINDKFKNLYDTYDWWDK